MRLDQWLFSKGLAKSRTHAEDMISRGDVQIYNMTTDVWQSVLKPSFKVQDHVLVEHVRIESELTKYVSRGGLKLEKALAYLSLDISGQKALDVGQSTGGFTDCLLQKGVAQVVGVEVGHDQIDPKLKSNPSNITFEGLDIRKSFAEPEFMSHVPFDFAVIDASFISLKHLLEPVLTLLAPGGRILALVKPQFELSAGDLDKRGIVRSPEKHQLVQSLIKDYVNALPQAIVLDYFQSEEKGKDGNVEFFIFMEKQI